MYKSREFLHTKVKLNIDKKAGNITKTVKP